MPVTEFADFQIKPGQEADFEAAAEKAVDSFRAASGCRAMSIHRLIERPDIYRLVVIWETLEAHTVTFRNATGFQEWRALVGPYFAAQPQVDHATIAVQGF